MKRLCIILLTIFITLCANGRSFAKEISGEIININIEYSIAFTDISSDYLKPNDVVQVFQEGSFVTYLRVSQVSKAISRLVPITSNTKYQTKVDFKDIAVGSTVVKVDLNESAPSQSNFLQHNEKNISSMDVGTPQKIISENEQNDTTLVSQPTFSKEKIESLNDRVKELSENYVRLSKSLSELLMEKKDLEEQRDAYKLELDNALKGVDAFKIENGELQNEIARLKKQLETSQCDKLEEEVRVLRTTLSQLKKSLLDMKENLKKDRK